MNGNGRFLLPLLLLDGLLGVVSPVVVERSTVLPVHACLRRSPSHCCCSSP